MNGCTCCVHFSSCRVFIDLIPIYVYTSFINLILFDVSAVFSHLILLEQMRWNKLFHLAWCVCCLFLYLILLALIFFGTSQCSFYLIYYIHLSHISRCICYIHLFYHTESSFYFHWLYPAWSIFSHPDSSVVLPLFTSSYLI